MTTAVHTLELTGFENLKLIADRFGNPADPTVLFAHGGGQTRHAWRATAETLAGRGFCSIVLDLRGHGDSAWCPDENYSLAYYAQDLIAVANSFDKKIHVVGASLGGLASMLVEGAYAPGTFASLTMVDITPRMEEKGVAQVLGFMAAHSEHGFASLDEAADIVAEYMPHRTRPKSTAGLAKNLRLGDDGRYRWHWDPAFVTQSNRARNSNEKFASHPQLEKVAEGVKCPTHLIRGKLSQLVSEEAAQHFLEVVPQAQYTDISGAGHMIAGDKNDIFTDAVLSFITAV